MDQRVQLVAGVDLLAPGLVVAGVSLGVLDHHVDMDVLDPCEVMGHGNKVPGGPSSEELATLFEMIFERYPSASAIGFATIPSTDEGGL